METSPTPTLDTIIDISHESLIRQWDTLKNWVIDEAKSADTYLRLEETARLYRAKNADPYRGLDLQGALAWRKAERPTDAWAKRYGAKGKETEAFEGAIAFLEESAKNRDKEQASQGRRRRQERIGTGVVFVLAVTVAALIYSYFQWQSAEQQRLRADEQTHRAEEHKQGLLSAIMKLTYVIQRGKLSTSTKKNLMDLLAENVQLLHEITEQKGDTPEALRTKLVTWRAISRGSLRLWSRNRGAVGPARPNKSTVAT